MVVELAGQMELEGGIGLDVAELLMLFVDVDVLVMSTLEVSPTTGPFKQTLLPLIVDKYQQ